MNVCPSCKFHNPDTNVRCFRCQALLREDPEEYQEAVKRARKTTESPELMAVKGMAEKAWQRSATRRFWDVPEDLPHRFPFTAGLLAILPGLGQLYNHQWKKAALLAGLWAAFAVIGVETIRHPLSNVILAGFLFYWLYTINDAVGTAIRIDGQRWSLRNSLALYCGIMFLCGMVITAAQWFLPFLLFSITMVWGTAIVHLWSGEGAEESKRLKGLLLLLCLFMTALGALAWHSNTQRIFTFVRLIKSVHAPQIKRGDIVFVNNMAYWLGSPRFGEIIHFDPARFTLQRGDTYVINIQDYFQRVCGVPGDTIEKRNGLFYRNGAPFPPGCEPIGGGHMRDGLKIIVPPGRYFAPITAVPDDAFASALHGITVNDLFGGGILKDWDKASLVTHDELIGRAVAIVNPPANRCWLSPLPE